MNFYILKSNRRPQMTNDVTLIFFLAPDNVSLILDEFHQIKNIIKKGADFILFYLII
jgi:hypothetical protein